MELKFPKDMAPHVRHVLDGEYEIKVEGFSPKVILDIGANIGAFTAWAKFAYPNAKIYAYEPVPDTFQFLVKNCAKLKHVELFNAAITDEPDDPVEALKTMFLGLHNIGEASFYDLGAQKQETVQVKTMSTDTLPACNFLKVDTEGSELEIILPYLKRVKPEVIAFEFHSESDRKTLQQELEWEYNLLGGSVIGMNRGVLKYVKREALAS